MKIFLSHVSQDRSAAEAIAFSLRERGHKVFLDRDDLPVGQGFDERIERAVKQSEIFIFLISPDSVTAGRYTLTELLFARQKWPSPSGHVLPVRVRTTRREQIPSYLKAVTILEPQGNVAAEASAKVGEMRPHAEADREEVSTATEPSKAVNPIWAFLIQRKNREVLAWIGGGLVVVATGLWAIFVYVFPPKKDLSDATNTEATCGGVAIGGNVSGSTITAGAPMNSNCSTKPK
jgi:TIR domain